MLRVVRAWLCRRVESKFRIYSISKRREFEKLRHEGRKVRVNSWLLANFLPLDVAVLRVGWTIPRQVGSAVIRNRLRRWGREYLRNWGRNQNPGLVVNLVFRPRERDYFKQLSHEEFDDAFALLVSKIERALV